MSQYKAQTVEKATDRIYQLLLCPSCGGDLVLDRFDESNGVFRCAESCGTVWPFIDDIPRFVDIDLLKGSPSFQTYLHQFGTELESIGADFLDDLDHTGRPTEMDNSEIENDTNTYFGHAWSEASEWGWIDESEVPKSEELRYNGGTIQATESAWESKALMCDDDIGPGSLVLDAGCGNGRFSEMAAQTGASVISVDLGTETVEAASRNLDARDNVFVVQGNLFELPFKRGVFDSAFSIGVLHHTGDARAAFESVSQHVSDDGIFSVTVYHKLNPVWMKINDALRSYTTDLSIESGERFAEGMASLARVAHRIHPHVLHGLNLLFRLQPTRTHMFDWYSAPTASFHTYSEVERWFIENGFTITNTNKTAEYDDRLILQPWAATVKGSKSDSTGSGGFFPYFG